MKKNIPSKINIALEKLTKGIKEIFGNRAKKVILYGSYARGDNTVESDVDIALILKDEPSKEMTDRMIDRTAAGELESGKVLSVLDIQSYKFEHWKNAVPFYRSIEKEGIILWKEA